MNELQQLGHDRLSTFGIGGEHQKNEWQSIFRQLVALNLLTIDNSEYGSVKITPQGGVFLKQKETLRFRKWVRAAKSKSKSSSRMPVAFDSEEDEALFEALRAKRLELAREQNVASFVIFHDRVLREIASKKPTSWKEFGKIAGVGQAKLERYWDEFTAVVIAHLEKL
jgi:ATP-dependent DNA helicase RecQ